MTMKINHVLVYGSLRAGQYAEHKMDDCEYIGLVDVPGVMYSLGAFPGVKLGGDDTFVAELYYVPDNYVPDIIAALDNYEGYYPKYPDASLYIRKTVKINDVYAYIYEVNREPSATSRIHGGDWCKKITRII